MGSSQNFCEQVANIIYINREMTSLCHYGITNNNLTKSTVFHYPPNNISPFLILGKMDGKSVDPLLCSSLFSPLILIIME